MTSKLFDNTGALLNAINLAANSDDDGPYKRAGTLAEVLAAGAPPQLQKDLQHYARDIRKHHDRTRVMRRQLHLVA